jgi:VIT1/CCC1 family predicted Fe2+/Mn2+ transporter
MSNAHPKGPAIRRMLSPSAYPPNPNTVAQTIPPAALKGKNRKGDKPFAPASTAASARNKAMKRPKKTIVVWVEKARGENAMMPLALFGSSSFIGLTLLTLLLYGALGVLVVLVPYVLIEAAAYSGTAAGAALLPFAVVLALVSPLLGRLSGRIGARVPLSVGSLTTRAVGVNPTFTSPTEIAVSKRGGQTWTTHPASSHW